MNKLELRELSLEEQVKIDGGWIKEVVGLAVAVGIWAFDKGEELGRALAAEK